MLPLTSELKKTAGVFAESAWAGAAFYLLLFVLASHVRYFDYVNCSKTYYLSVAAFDLMLLRCYDNIKDSVGAT